MAYNKNDAYKALTHLKEDYSKVKEGIERGQSEIKIFEQYDTNLKLAKKGATIIGRFFSVLFGLGMLTGFIGFIPFVVFASLCGLSVLGTLGIKAYYNTLIHINKKFLEDAETATETMEYINSNIVIPRVDALQDVVHLDKPITKGHEEIIDEWKDTSAFKNLEINTQKDDDMEL